MNDSSVKVSLTRGQYSVTFQVNVPDEYPAEVPEIVFQRSNIHERLVGMHLAQANEIIRRCKLGYSADVAFMSSNPIKIPKMSKLDMAKEVRCGLCCCCVHFVVWWGVCLLL